MKEVIPTKQLEKMKVSQEEEKKTNAGAPRYALSEEPKECRKRDHFSWWLCSHCAVNRPPLTRHQGGVICSASEAGGGGGGRGERPSPPPPVLRGGGGDGYEGPSERCVHRPRGYVESLEGSYQKMGGGNACSPILVKNNVNYRL